MHAGEYAHVGNPAIAAEIDQHRRDIARLVGRNNDTKPLR